MAEFRPSTFRKDGMILNWCVRCCMPPMFAKDTWNAIANLSFKSTTASNYQTFLGQHILNVGAIPNFNWAQCNLITVTKCKNHFQFHQICSEIGGIPTITPGASWLVPPHDGGLCLPAQLAFACCSWVNPICRERPCLHGGNWAEIDFNIYIYSWNSLWEMGKAQDSATDFFHALTSSFSAGKRTYHDISTI